MLDQKVEIYVPSTVRGTVAAPRLAAQQADEVLTHLASWFGGASVIFGQGAWMGRHGLVKEDIRIVYSFTDAKTLELRREDIFNLANCLARVMSQEAISVVINGDMFFEDGSIDQDIKMA